MVVRRCLFLLILLGVISQCAARRNYRQTSRLLMRTPVEHIGNVLLYRQFVENNIVARDFLPPRPLWELSLETKLRKQDSAYIRTLFPKKRQEYAILGSGEYTQNERTYFGDFCLAYSSFDARYGAKTPNADYFYPYLVLDTTRSAPAGWTGHLSFGHIWRTRQWIFGIAGECKAEQIRAEGDIRHLTKGIEFSLREGVYVWVDDYWLGQWGTFSHYWQQIEVTSQIGARPFYRHLGFGLWNWDRTIDAEAMSFDNKTGQVEAGLQVTSRDDGLVADVHGAHRWMFHADKAYLAAASSERQNLRARLGYRIALGEGITECLADIKLHNRTGVEHFYDSVGRRGNKRYERLFASPMYTNTTRIIGMSIASELPIRKGYAWGKIWGGYGTYRSKYENPENNYRNSYFRCEAEFGYLFRKYDNWLSFQIRGALQSHANAERSFSRHLKEPLKSSFLLPTLANLEASQLEVAVQLECGYKLRNAYTLVAVPHLGIHTLPNVGNSFYGGLVLRIRKE